MADGLGMKSLSAFSILKALRDPDVAQTLIAIETYNATAIDKTSNHYASVLAERLDMARTASSDAHIVEAIGLGATEFNGHTAQDLIKALQRGYGAAAQAKGMELCSHSGKLGREICWQCLYSSCQRGIN